MIQSLVLSGDRVHSLIRKMNTENAFAMKSCDLFLTRHSHIVKENFYEEKCKVGEAWDLRWEEEKKANLDSTIWDFVRKSRPRFLRPGHPKVMVCALF